MSVQPLISIIVPVYNSESFLARCIDSILNQTLKNIELILVNDGCTDGSKDIIESYVNKDVRVIAVHKNNGGVSSARNAGLNIARGAYITFIDSDDRIEHSMLESMYESIVFYDVELVAVGVVMENTRGIIIDDKTTGIISAAFKNPEIGVLINKVNFSYSIAKLYLAEVLQKRSLRFNTDLSLGEDALFACSYLAHINSVALIDKPFYHYVRCNDNSLSSKYSPGIELFIQMIWDKLEELYVKFPEFKRLQHGHDNSSRAINSAKMHFNNMYKKECPLTAEERRRIATRYITSAQLYNDLKIYKPTTYRDYMFFYLIKSRSSFVIDAVYSLCKPIFLVINFFLRVKK